MYESMPKVVINYEHDGISEWAGDGYWDGGGIVDCTADLGIEVYEEIEELLSEDETEGTVTVDGFTYSFALIEPPDDEDDESD
jgi:hypothetical protein